MRAGTIFYESLLLVELIYKASVDEEVPLQIRPEVKRHLVWSYIEENLQIAWPFILGFLSASKYVATSGPLPVSCKSSFIATQPGSLCTFKWQG